MPGGRIIRPLIDVRHRRAQLRAFPSARPTLLARSPGVRKLLATAKTAMKVKKTLTALAQRRRKNPMARKLVKGATGGQATFSKFSANREPSKRVKTMKNVGAANYYVTNDAQQLQIAEGFQGVQDFSFQNTAHLKQIASYTPASGAVPKQYVLGSATCEYLITNSTLATMYVDIYDVVRKRDADNDEIGTLAPTQAWKVGVDNQSGGSSDYLNINSLPTDSRLFKEYFKVVQRNHIGLSQGATHRHSVKLKSNELITTALLNAKDTDEDLAGITVYTMICVYGQPASVPGEPGAPATVTTAKGAIDVVRSIRYKYTWVQDDTNSWYLTDNLSSLPGEYIVSAGAGQFFPNQSV